MSFRRRITYIGNQLSGHGYPPTTIETLAPLLSKRFELDTASSKKNYFPRLLEMWWKVLKTPLDGLILIDTYSTLAFHFAWTCAWIARLRGVPYVPILHGGNLPDRMDRSPKLCKLLFLNAFQVVSPSNYLKAEVEQRFSVKVKVIPNFIDLELYPYQDKSYKTIRLLWVRSFHQIYNPELAVKVLKGIHDAGFTDAQLCMVGPDKDGSLNAVKRLSEELSVKEFIQFTGKLSKIEWIEKSFDYNFFINTTNFDNTPVSVMEAMVLGFPVVSTNVGGMPYLVKNGVDGILVPPNDAQSFIEQIIKLYHSPEVCKQISMNARKKAEHWDWNIIKQQWGQLIEGESISA